MGFREDCIGRAWNAACKANKHIAQGAALGYVLDALSGRFLADTNNRIKVYRMVRSHKNR